MSWSELLSNCKAEVETKNPWPRLLIFLFGFYLGWENLAGRNPWWNAFSYLDLGLHEVGHIVTMPFGLAVSIPMGTLAQWSFPLIVGIALYRSRDFFGMSFMLVWWSMSFMNSSQYAASAQANGPVIGALGNFELLHDWYYMLNALGILHWDDAIGGFLKVIAVLFFISYLATSSILLFWMVTKRMGSTYR